MKQINNLVIYKDQNKESCPLADFLGAGGGGGGMKFSKGHL